MDLKRSYEVSIWTLQDEFITVLKPCNVENLGRLENKELELNADDGINKYSFSIPMYIYEGTERIENPIWYNTLNGNIIANMRKIKVIINKKTAVEAVYEFIIIKVEERHEKDQLYCDVTCEDLAYNELGKIGYKLELSQELYEQEDYEWSQSDMTEDEPINNLQYWNSHQLHLYSINKNGQVINDNGEVCNEQLQANKWYYMVQMDWTAYANGANRDTEKVYEEEYTTSWAESGNKLIATGTEPYKEKTREIDAKESNIFNLTQTIAEKFGIFVRYEYLYDSNYHITGRRIIYYNNFMRENDGYLDITYPYNTSDIKREIDGADITTKMYVRPVDSDVSDSGVFSIVDAAPNKSKEDYILNFEYMYQIGAISAEQYAEIGAYELKMRRLNIQHENVSTTIDGLTTEIKDLEALKTSLDNQIQKDQEGIDEAEDKLNAIKIKYGNGDAVSIDQNRPDTAILKPQSESNYYYIDITREGVVRETLHLYKDYYSTNENKLTNELQGVFVEDENGNLIRVKDIYSTELDLNKTIFLTYDYRPTLKTECVKKEYTAKLASDEDKLNEVKAELISKNNILTNLYQAQSDIEDEQQSARKQFEEMMGPALRESYWQPEDYKTTGEKYIDTLTTSDTPGASGYTTLIWDKELFEGEQDTKYQYGINQQDVYYPCIQLNETTELENEENTLQWLQRMESEEKTVSFVFYDITEGAPALYTVKNLRLFPIGDDVTQSRARYGYGKKSGGDITPILILTGAKGVSNLTMENLATDKTDGNNNIISPLLAVIEKTDDPASPIAITESHKVTWFNKNQSNSTITWDAVSMYYPRIKINSMALNDSNTVLHYNNNLLEQYKDYYIFFRTENISNNQSNPEYETYKYITIKPKPYILKSADNLNITLYFSLYNINTAIYLDALQVMKENSMPKVSYTVEPNFINNHLYYALYRNLNRIVNINDKDLKLVNVQGYISKITLDLDNPFNDKIDIKNYKSKFEDLFTTIVAQTEAMKKNGYVVGLASAAFTPTGVLAPETIQQSINRADLQYSFNQGNLTIDEENGIWATSDDGVVAMRGGGIFTATRKDDEGNWLWNTGILPSGINANLITTGQLDTNLIRIYAGDKLRLQMNGDGYFAYKSLFDDPEILEKFNNGEGTQDALKAIEDSMTGNGALDLKQYVVHNENGLFLRAENGAIIKDSNGLKVLDKDKDNNTINCIDRVEISWDGLKLRNWNGDEVFYADPNTGDLTLEGRIKASSMIISDDGTESSSIKDYIDDEAGKAAADVVSDKIFEYKQQYRTTTTASEPSMLPDSDWSDTKTTVTNDQYLWGRTVKVKVNNDNTRTIVDRFGLVLLKSKTTESIPIDRVYLSSSDLYFVKDKNGSYSPNEIVFTTYIQGNSSISKWNIGNGEYISTSTTPTGITIDWDDNICTITHEAFGNDEKILLVKVTTDSNPAAVDQITIHILQDGQDAISPVAAILTNERGEFIAKSNGKLPSNTVFSTDIVGYVNGVITQISSLKFSIDGEHWTENVSSVTYYDGGLNVSASYDSANTKWTLTFTGYTNKNLGTDGPAAGSIKIKLPDDPFNGQILSWNWTKILNGRVLETVYEWYAVNNDKNTAPTSWTKNTIPNSYGNDAPYLWNYEELSYTDGSTSTTTTPCIISVYGRDGAPGSPGRGITNILEYYILSTSSANIPSGYQDETGGWSSTISMPTVEKPYLWNYEKIEYTSGSPKRTTPIVIAIHSSSPIIYELMPSASAIKKEGNTMTPNSISFTVTRHNGEVPETITAGYKIYVSKNGGTETEINDSSYTVLNDTTSLKFLLKVNGEIKDSQTVPVVTDGKDGDPTYTMILSNELHAFSVNTPSSTTCGVQLFKGTQPIGFRLSISTNPLPGGISIDSIARDDTEVTIHYDPSAQNAVTSGKINIVATLTDGSNLAFNKDFSFTVGGAQGPSGTNVAQIMLYKRSAIEPSKNGFSTWYYYFATNKLLTSTSVTDEPNDYGDDHWTRSIPATDGNPCWVLSATANGTGAYDDIGTNEWNGPIKILEDGHDGNPGYNSATVYLYKRANTTPTISFSSAPTYTFSTGVLSGTLNGWSQSIPEVDQDNNPCWVSTTAAIATTATVNLPTQNWSTPVKLVEDGTSIIDIIELYYFKINSTVSVPTPTKTTTIHTDDRQNAWTTIVPTYVSGGEYWRCLKYVFSDGNIAFSTPFKDDSMTEAYIIAKSKNKTYRQSTEPTDYHQGDIWVNTQNNNQYMAAYNFNDSNLPDTMLGRWVIINKRVTGTTMDINPDEGTINITAASYLSIASGENLSISGNGFVNVGGGAGINIATGGKLTTSAENFMISSNGNVAVTGAITATSIALGPEASARDNFNNLVQNTAGYESLKNTATAIAQEVEQNRPILNTMTFTPTDGLVIRASEDSLYSTATKNDGYYIRYNNTEVAKFTGNVTQLSSLAIGDIIVKRSNRGGWMWVDNE